jgi:N-acetylneuraminic acid mutarotase
MLKDHSQHCSIGYNDTVLVIGGMHVYCEALFVASRTWTIFPELTIPRAGAAATVSGDDIYLMGGLDVLSTTYYSSIEQYNSKTEQWSLLPQSFELITPIAFCGIFKTSETTALLVGGSS